MCYKMINIQQTLITENKYLSCINRSYSLIILIKWFGTINDLNRNNKIYDIIRSYMDATYGREFQISIMCNKMINMQQSLITENKAIKYPNMRVSFFESLYKPKGILTSSSVLEHHSRIQENILNCSLQFFNHQGNRYCFLQVSSKVLVSKYTIY